jgi:hypothetical protein
MASYSFSETVATRTRAASHILNTPALLQAFLDIGGLEADLTAIIQNGLEAERANESQSRGLALDMAATADAQAAFGALQREYKLVMAVARAVLEDLIDAGASQETLEAMRRVLADETAVHIKTVKGEGDSTVKKALKKRSQEAIRAEIWKDASALMERPELSAAMANRRVTAERLTALRTAAALLEGRLTKSILDKAARKAATAAENVAVRNQSRRWNAVYGLLRRLDDDALRSLLKLATS